MITKCKALAGTTRTLNGSDEETTMSIVTIAKRIVEKGPQAYPSVSKAMFYSEIAKRADASRRADETSEGAFVRVATTDDDGRALFAAYKVAGSPDYRPADHDLQPKRAVLPPNAAHEQLMRKAEELAANIAKSGNGKPITLEQAYQKVFTDPANQALARAALHPASMKGAPPVDDDEDEDDGNPPTSYEDDGGNTAHNARNAVIGRLSTDKDKTGRPASATRTFGFGGRKAKVAARVQKFLTMCPGASDDEALGYALSPKRVRKAYEARLKAS